jgi:hypothetical protein
MLNDLVARTVRREILGGSGCDRVGVGQFLREHCDCVQKGHAWGASEMVPYPIGCRIGMRSESILVKSAIILPYSQRDLCCSTLRRAIRRGYGHGLWRTRLAAGLVPQFLVALQSTHTVLSDHLYRNKVLLRLILYPITRFLSTDPLDSRDPQLDNTAHHSLRHQ